MYCLTGIKTILTFSLIVFLNCLISETHAQLSLSKIFSNGAVLQRDHVIPVWGKAPKDTTITVTLKGVSEETQADSNGNWYLELSSTSAGGPYIMTVETGSQQINLSNIYIGDVWLASGQSNMELAVSGADSASTVIANANDQAIRQFKIPKGLSNEPSDDLPNGSSWTPATSQYVGNFSAVAYFFALNLKPHINCPIGIINSSYGGSRIETWMTDELLGYDESDTLLAAGEPERQPTLAYNKMIHPILRYPIKGVIWYQGESNADNLEDALNYSELFQTQIQGWRDLWNEGDFPFIWVQLPNYGQSYSEPQTFDAWPQLRAGQSAALTLPNTGEAVTIDVGGLDIHPKYKQPVGYRLSLIARHVAYGEDLVYSGPRYSRNLLREDGKIEINYTDTGSGLLAKDSPGGEVTGFAVAGENGNLAWANAVIDGEKVLVWNDNVPEPQLVRYAWEYNPADVNLYNEEGLPAAPFLDYVNPGFKIVVFKPGHAVIEEGESTTLTWLVFGSSSVELDDESVDTAGTITINPAETTTYTLTAINRDDSNEIDTASVTVTVLDPSLINRAYNRSVKASTFSTCCGDGDLKPELAVDDSLNTRWSSAWFAGDNDNPADPNLDGDPNDEWIIADLGESIDIDNIILYWEAAYGREYDIDLSYDGYIWRTAYQEKNGNGDQDNIVLDTVKSGRYIRIHGIQRGTQYGYSIWEISVYGVLAALKPPAVNVNTDGGNVVSPNTQMNLIANVTDPDSGTIEKAEFFVNDVSTGTVNSAPFQVSWTATGTENFSITIQVTDNDGLTVQSDPYIIYLDNGTMTRFEAEDAAYTGQVNIINSPATSGGSYLEMRDAWTLTFNNIGVPETGDYLLSLGYQLTFESPKTQFILINGDTLTALEFTAPSTSLWLKRGVIAPLVEGTNEIAVYGFWNWMSIDFLGIPGATILSIDEPAETPVDYALAQNFPNPFNPETSIRYSIPKQAYVTIKVFDILGSEIATLVNEEKSIGNYEVKFSANDRSASGGNSLFLPSGVYFYRLQADDFTSTKKMIVLK